MLVWKKYNAKAWWDLVLLAMRKCQEMQDFCFHFYTVLKDTAEKLLMRLLSPSVVFTPETINILAMFRKLYRNLIFKKISFFNCTVLRNVMWVDSGSINWENGWVVKEFQMGTEGLWSLQLSYTAKKFPYVFFNQNMKNLWEKCSS